MPDAEPQPAPPPASGNPTMPLKTAAQLLMLTEQRVLQLVKQGYIPRSARDAYPLVGVVQGYIRFLKDDERRSSKSAAASTVQTARAAEIKQLMDIRSRKLIDLDEALGIVDEVVGLYNSELSGLPAACTRDLTMRNTIEAQVERVQGKVAKDLAERAKNARSGGKAGEAGPEDDA